MNSFLNLVDKYVNIIALVMAALILIMMIITFRNAGRIKKLAKKYNRFMMGISSTGMNIEDTLIEHIKRVNQVSDENNEIKEMLNEHDTRIALSTQKIGIVRYSAFQDVGSDLSFSIAILDSKDNGFVLTSIYSRENSTTYSKPIINSVSKYTLSAEEASAIETAKKNYIERQMNFAGIKKDSKK